MASSENPPALIMAANTTLPVIGVPMGTSSLNGFDALLSTVQMPGGIPVATMAIDKAGAINAAFLPRKFWHSRTRK